MSSFKEWNRLIIVHTHYDGAATTDKKQNIIQYGFYLWMKLMLTKGELYVEKHIDFIRKVVHKFRFCGPYLWWSHFSDAAGPCKYKGKCDFSTMNTDLTDHRNETLCSIISNLRLLYPMLSEVSNNFRDLFKFLMTALEMIILLISRVICSSVWWR